MIKFLTASTVALISLIGLVVVAAALVVASTPNADNIKSCLTTAMFQVRLCPTEPGYVKLNQISPHLRNAVIVSEDSSFYSHNGFDWFELRESFQTNLEKGTFARGGSTITQQLAKNVYLSPEKSVLRKLREGLVTVQLEKLLTKDQILEKYLNVVEFGENIYGIGKASRHYFKKPPSALTPTESAFLAFLLPSPKSYSVSFRKKSLTPFARSRVREIVNRMGRFKKISPEEQQMALAQVDYLFGGSPPPTPLPEGEEALPTAEEMGEDYEGGFDEAVPTEIEEPATLPSEPSEPPPQALDPEPMEQPVEIPAPEEEAEEPVE